MDLSYNTHTYLIPSFYKHKELKLGPARSGRIKPPMTNLTTFLSQFNYLNVVCGLLPNWKESSVADFMPSLTRKV